MKWRKLWLICLMLNLTQACAPISAINDGFTLPAQNTVDDEGFCVKDDVIRTSKADVLTRGTKEQIAVHNLTFKKWCR